MWLVWQPHALLSRLKSRTSEHEQAELSVISEAETFTATLLPIKTVGVQVCRQLIFVTVVVVIVVVVAVVVVDDTVALLAGQQTRDSQVAGSSPCWAPLRSCLGQVSK